MDDLERVIAEAVAQRAGRTLSTVDVALLTAVAEKRSANSARTDLVPNRNEVIPSAGTAMSHEQSMSMWREVIAERNGKRPRPNAGKLMSDAVIALNAGVKK